MLRQDGRRSHARGCTRAACRNGFPSRTQHIHQRP